MLSRAFKTKQIKTKTRLPIINLVTSVQTTEYQHEQDMEMTQKLHVYITKVYMAQVNKQLRSIKPHLQSMHCNGIYAQITLFNTCTQVIHLTYNENRYLL